MNKTYKITFIVLIMFFMGQVIYAQDSGEVKVYKTQLLELHSKVKSLTLRVEKQGSGAPNYELKLNLREEMLALRKLTNSLNNETGEANISQMKQGHNENKTLLLIGQGCDALNFIIISLGNYVATDDKAFLSFAKDGHSLIESINKIL